MPGVQEAVAFFDLGNTLAAVHVSSTGDRIESLAVYPYVPRVLQDLHAQGVRLGIISNADGLIGERLRTLEILQVGPGIGIEVECVIDSGAVGVMKPDPRIFAMACDAISGGSGPVTLRPMPMATHESLSAAQRASQSTPDSFRFRTSTSLGHLSCACTPRSSSVFAMARPTRRLRTPFSVAREGRTR